MQNVAFKDAKRELSGLTASLEKKILHWFAAHMPERVNSDHLSILGLLALFFGGVGYLCSRYDPMFLHLVNLCLLLNWFGDSLDGTLARYRDKSRPRYGFYVDHIIDTFGTLFLLGGLACSGYMSERIAFGLLAVYYMLMINSNLAAYTIGRFQISYGLFGPTELRIVLAIGNIALIYHPYSTILGERFLLYDVGGFVAIVGMAVTLVISVIRNTRTLYALERV